MSIDYHSNQTKISTLIKSLTKKLCAKFEQLLTEDINLKVHAWFSALLMVVEKVAMPVVEFQCAVSLFVYLVSQ